jgi:hypothetical protein
MGFWAPVVEFPDLCSFGLFFYFYFIFFLFFWEWLDRTRPGLYSTALSLIRQGSRGARAVGSTIVNFLTAQVEAQKLRRLDQSVQLKSTQIT